MNKSTPKDSKLKKDKFHKLNLMENKFQIPIKSYKN